MQTTTPMTHQIATPRPGRGDGAAGRCGSSSAGGGRTAASPRAPRALAEHARGRVVVAEQLDHRGPGDGWLAGSGRRALDHQRAQRLGQQVQVPGIRRVGGPPAAANSIGARPRAHVGGGGRGAVRRGDPELDHPRAVRAEHHVLGAEVAVHQPGLVDGGQPGRGPDGQRLEVGALPWPLVGHQLEQRGPGDVLADQEGVTALEPGAQDPGRAERRHPRTPRSPRR